MSELSKKKCVPCTSSVRALSLANAEEYIKITPAWEIGGFNINGKLAESYISRAFPFDNDRKAWEFCNKVAELAQQENHHPILLWDYRKVEITYTTHAIRNLTENDFIMAAKIDEVFSRT